MPRYEPARIEPKWQAFWDANATFRAPDLPTGEKLYVLDMFPYPSGDGLHVGHPEGYTATDIVCRHARMQGKSVLHPMGWDAFGLPAEQYAVKTGTHPRITTDKNITTFRRQLKSLGFSYDWSRELSTTDPEYVRWTQWIFLRLFDTWFDPEQRWTGADGKERVGQGRPIAELPIPSEVHAAGALAVERYQDSKRLAYLHEAPVNWCPALGTVLANEEVTADGKSDRGNHPVERRPLKQWMLRITAYAERLLSELDDVNWPESIKSLQRNWIGRSEGAEVDFPLAASGEAAVDAWRTARAKTCYPAQPDEGCLRIYTTRPDTLFGVTYMVLAPEHPAVERLVTPEQQGAVEAYRRQTTAKSDLDRTDLAKSKTGVFTGGYAINPLNGERVPVWIADYVLMTYGTGAIMAVPAHDERDCEFATTFGIPIRPVVAPPTAWLKAHAPKDLAGADEASLSHAYMSNPVPFGCFADEGVAVNSGAYTGLTTPEFQRRVRADLASQGIGRTAVNYRLRDWLFSRQRYWGEPFPILHELGPDGTPTGRIKPVELNQLPVRLPDMEDFQPTGTPDPLLSKAPSEWRNVTAADGSRWVRETNTMPQWAGSCWYYLRFADNTNSERFIDPVKEQAWLPVDLYIGGAEHAVLHLLYSRFWHKVLFDRGDLIHPEPFRRLVNQGMILGEAEITGYRTSAGAWVSVRETTEGESGERVRKGTKEPLEGVVLEASQVAKKGNDFVLVEDAAIVVESRAFKMSKSRGNVINPDSIVREYGADSLRLYEMFMGPLEATKPWSMSGVEGVSRFLSRVWRMIVDDRSETVVLNPAIVDDAPTADQNRFLHRTIQAVSRDIEHLSFNTAISRMMEFLNEFSGLERRPRAVIDPFVLLLAPFAPHIAEELWEVLGHRESLAYARWPEFDPALLVESTVEIPVQFSGKVRGKVVVPKGADQAAVEAVVRADAKLSEQFTGKTVVKTIFVADRMVNFVVK
jgi:leucyl-tRNA synthetase